MAKSTQSTSGALALLDAAERRIFDASRGTALAAATKAQLGTLVGQARALRDKWRDQFRDQRRSSQRAAAARGVGGNERSRAKSDLFADVVSRIEARLAELGTSVARAVTSATGGGPTKAARARMHRATRASTRAALAEFVSQTTGPASAVQKVAAAVRGAAKPGGFEKAGARKAPGKPAAAKTGAVGKSAAKTEAPAKAGATGKQVPTKRTVAGSKKRRTGRPATVAATKATSKHKSQVIAALPAAQVRAATKLKASRVRLAGLDTRLRGHTTAQGRRRQGRRDGRGT